jgi:hypothetical protein
VHKRLSEEKQRSLDLQCTKNEFSHPILQHFSVAICLTNFFPEGKKSIQEPQSIHPALFWVLNSHLRDVPSQMMLVGKLPSKVRADHSFQTSSGLCTHKSKCSLCSSCKLFQDSLIVLGPSLKTGLLQALQAFPLQFLQLSHTWSVTMT